MPIHKEATGDPLSVETGFSLRGPCRTHRHHDARSRERSERHPRFAQHTSRAFGRHASRSGKGFLEPCILLLLAEEPSHGYALSSRLKELGVVKMSPSPPIIYRSLHRLETEGLAVSDHVDQEGKGPARKVYRLTDEGWDAVSLWSDEMKEISKGIEEFQERYTSAEKSRQQSPEGGPSAGKTEGNDNEDG